MAASEAAHDMTLTVALTASHFIPQQRPLVPPSLLLGKADIVVDPLKAFNECAMSGIHPLTMSGIHDSSPKALNGSASGLTSPHILDLVVTCYLHDEDEYGIDEPPLGVLVAPLLRAVGHAVDAHEADHGWRKVYDVLAWIPQSCLSYVRKSCFYPT